MDEELSVCPAVRDLAEIDCRALIASPIEGVECLAASASALGFHHAFLFHAYKLMLPGPGEQFQDRLLSLREWWLNNAVNRDILVAIRLTRTGLPPPERSLGIEITRWQSLPERIRSSAKGCAAWRSHYEHCQETNPYFLLVTTSARDAYSAVMKAMERYRYYCALVGATSLSGRAIQVDDEWAFVDDASESPRPKGYAIRLEKGRLRFRGRYAPSSAAELHRACNATGALEAFVRHYSNSRRDAKLGNMDDALADFAAGVELAFDDYKAIGAEARYRPPRLFVEKSSILMALDWFRTHYHYLLEYALKPSFALSGNGALIDEKRPERAYALISDDEKWRALVSRCEWDELLKYRRNEILRELNSLPTVLTERCRQLRWDLARVIRARNALFHQGEPVQDDEYLPGLFLDAFDLILRLRLVGHKQGIGFNELVHIAEQDYEQLTRGIAGVSLCEFASFGWRRCFSKHGTDLPAKY